MQRLKPFVQHLPWTPITVLVIVVVVFLVFFSQPFVSPGGLGIGKGESVTTNVEQDNQGNRIKVVEVTKRDDGKTLWDWLSLLGVPLSLAVLGIWFQHSQQERAVKLDIERRARDEVLDRERRELADDQTKEEVLQVYFDRLSTLLVDKNLLAIADKEEKVPEEQALLDAAVDVIRARTLSILRRFEGDEKRKTSVIRFLSEADVISKLNLNLSRVDLSRANLSRANLSGVDLSDADLSGANLIEAKLGRANLQWAKLSDADLSNADLSDADLSAAKLCRATLSRANLRGAKFRDADLSDAGLEFARLNDRTDLKGVMWTQKTVWPDKAALVQARNIPGDIRRHCGLPDEVL